ncbi:MAG: Rhomboid protease GlpG [Ignavibacteriaceae bacterium]|nr:Rhomboid protease GlpG [Ignavibacteriaceae bacterium]
MPRSKLKEKMSNGNYRPAGFSFMSPVIKSLLIANFAVFFIEQMLAGITSGGMPLEVKILQNFALWPLDAGFLPWQLLTYQFMHASFGHIFFNLFSLWMFGTEIEYTLGSKKFLIFYLTSGVGAGLLHLLTPYLGMGDSPTVGASGAIYGVMIAFALFNPDRSIYIYFLFPVKAKYLIAFLVIMDLMMVNNAASNVAHLAHIGGAITGFLFLFFDKETWFPFKDKLRGGIRGGGGSSYGSFGGGHFSHQQRPDSSGKSGFSFNFKNKSNSSKIEDAKFTDISDDDEISQEVIDSILEKITKSGYTNLSQKEKDILFRASKKMAKKDNGG